MFGRVSRLRALYLCHWFTATHLTVLHPGRARARILVNENRSAILALVPFADASGHLDLPE